MKRVAFVFPGQGSQQVGMGELFLAESQQARSLFKQADQILGFPISTMISEGPTESLTETKYAQPALLLVSTMILERLTEAGVTPTVVAGHSLGEYSALVAANVLTFEQAIQLVHQRGKLMESADPEGQGGMAAVLGLDKQVIEEQLSSIAETVELANINCPGQIVISGTKTGIDAAVKLLKDAGAKRVIPLNVSGPFHSSLMQPVADDYEKLLTPIQFKDADVSIYTNVTAEKVTDAEVIKSLLVEQLYSPVRFHEIIDQLVAEQLDAIVEVGNGKVLSGLVKKVSRRAKVFSVQDPASFQDFINWYKGEGNNDK
ncbi:ACP S-malonyltransferase [Amphibacillus jilinensis]|uniref:ACP S-malonyltransferase n=1 Tax=Amphibacillus jilinensis TaxID=1216008 RepID=UPI000302CAB8|nr:ACP S-malonyltransferase [Amphibacillus jilinensis]